MVLIKTVNPTYCLLIGRIFRMMHLVRQHPREAFVRLKTTHRTSDRSGWKLVEIKLSNTSNELELFFHRFY